MRAHSCRLASMRFLAVLALPLLLSACGFFVYKIDVQQGNHVEQQAVAKLKTGMTKAEVKQVLGTPLLADVFHANRWDYYFSQEKGRKTEKTSRLSLFFVDEKLVQVTGEGREASPVPANPPAR